MKARNLKLVSHKLYYLFIVKIKLADGLGVSLRRA